MKVMMMSRSMEKNVRGEMMMTIGRDHENEVLAGQKEKGMTKTAQEEKLVRMT
uniref:Uncharacterized protein n=1 Tax=Rhizophora mucronata TaxID=61149 RepID=A0A2P2MRU9_RHIMU